MRGTYENFTETFEKLQILTNIQTCVALSKALEVSPATVLDKKNKNIFPDEWLYQLCSSQEVSLDYFLGENIELRSVDNNDLMEAHLHGVKKFKAGLARRLKAARTLAGYSFRTLGLKAGVAYQSLSAWEKDPPSNPSVEMMRKIATALKVHPVYLRTGKEFVYKDTGKPIHHKSIVIKSGGFRGGVGSTPEEARKNMEEYNPTVPEKLESIRNRAGLAISLIREEVAAENKTGRNKEMKASQRREREARKLIDHINHQVKEEEAELLNENPTQGRLFATG